MRIRNNLTQPFDTLDVALFYMYICEYICECFICYFGFFRLNKSFSFNSSTFDGQRRLSAYNANNSNPVHRSCNLCHPPLIGHKNTCYDEVLRRPLRNSCRLALHTHFVIGIRTKYFVAFETNINAHKCKALFRLKIENI